VVAAIEPDEPTTNYALRLTEGVDQPSTSVRRGLRAPVPEQAEGDSFALRLNDALAAINAAQTDAPALDGAPTPIPNGGLRGWLAALDKLPPIRLPIGPAIPWRLGLPALVAVVVLMAVVSRPSAKADAPAAQQLPTQQTYPVQDTAPLFARPEAQVQPAETPTAAPPLGIQDSSPLGFDYVDLGVKLLVVLALAYGSLMLLKRAGIGGGGASSRGGAMGQGVRVVSSLALAPNRSVHVIKVPGGRTLLVGATPNAVNLIADLGEVGEDATPEASSLFDVLKGRVGS
jgi:flagellar biogenesis protein FliO